MAHHGQARHSAQESLVPPPSRCPELNPTESIRQTHAPKLALEPIFENYDDIVTRSCEAWNKLVALPAIITSIGLRQCTYPS